MKSNSMKTLVRKLKRKGVSADVIADALAETMGYEARITRKDIATIKAKLKNVGDRVVITALKDRVKVFSMNGYKNLVDNASKARAGKEK